jgi:hypothetical protein
MKVDASRKHEFLCENIHLPSMEKIITTKKVRNFIIMGKSLFV